MLPRVPETGGHEVEKAAQMTKKAKNAAEGRGNRRLRGEKAAQMTKKAKNAAVGYWE